MAKPKRRAAKVIKKKKPSAKAREISKLKKEIEKLKIKLKSKTPTSGPTTGLPKGPTSKNRNPRIKSKSKPKPRIKSKPKSNPKIKAKPSSGPRRRKPKLSPEIIKLEKQLNRYRHSEIKLRAIAFNNMVNSGLYSGSMAERAVRLMSNGTLLKATTATISDFEDMAGDSYYEEYDTENDETYSIFWYHD